MIGLSDLGLTPPKGPATKESQAEKAKNPYAPDPLVPGSTEAQALYHIMRGDPVVSVASPPGGGKSTLVATVIHWIQHVSPGLKIGMVAPTGHACRAMAKRVAHLAGSDRVMLVGNHFRRDKIDGVVTPGVVKALSPWEQRQIRAETPVEIRTLASAKFSPPSVDIMIIDEAYQAMFSDAADAADRASQVLLVGDPGQIGPVVTVDTTPWDHMELAPHKRAPEGFTARGGAISLHLPRTYRLGERTVEAVQPLYDFPFTSGRPEVAMPGRDEIETITLPTTDVLADRAMLDTVVTRAQELVGSRVTGSNGQEMTLGPEDVAVVAARNEQTSALRAFLRGIDLGEVTVGTADSLQGGQWIAVIAVDPLYGSPTVSGHSASLGRLCVMVSRHVAHLTWVTSQDWPEVVNTVEDADERAKHSEVRRRLA